MPRRRKRNEVLVGSFVCLGAGLFLLLLFLMGTLDPLIAQTVDIEADFEDVHGLQSGDAVYLFGLKSGKVRAIELLPRGAAAPATIRVTFSLPARHRSYLRQDSIVRIDKSLTGNISLVIQEGQGGKLGQGERLRGRATANFAAVAERVNRVLDEGEKVIAYLAEVSQEIAASGSLPRVVDDVVHMTSRMRAEMGPLSLQFHEVVDAVEAMLEENRPGVREVVANLQQSSASMRKLTARMEPIGDTLEVSLKELERASHTVTEAIVANRGHLDVIMEDLRKTCTNAANLTAEVKRRPWRLLYRPSDTEKNALDLYDAAWAYNLGATELNRAVRELAAHLENASAGSSRSDLDSIYDKVRESLQKQTVAESAFWARLESNR